MHRKSGNRRHILFLGKYYPPVIGGTEDYARLCVTALSTAFKTTVVCFSQSPKTIIDRMHGGLILRCARLAEIKSQPISYIYPLLVRRFHPDLIIYNAPNYIAALAILLTPRNIPIVTVHHSDVFGRKLFRTVFHPIHKRVVQRSSMVVVNSLRNVNSAQDLPAVDVPVAAIPHGLDEASYVIDDALRCEAKRLRERLGKSFIVGFVGRHVRYKGLDVIVKALTKRPEVGCIIVGDGPKRLEIEELARNLGVSDRILFLGSVNHQQKLAAIEAMDTVLMPSTDKAEAFGVVQIEAQLLGKPVIIGDLPTGVRDITQPEITGLVVPTNDAEALAAAIARLAADPGSRARMGSEGRKIALAKFTERTFAENLILHVQYILSGKDLSATETIRSLKNEGNRG